jgi:hypothetical protein
MATRHLLSSAARESFFDIPSGMASLEKFYVLATDDLDLISSRRGAENRLGLAIHIALLRHPGQGWRDNDQIPPEVIHWLSDQIHVSTSALDIYGNRESTRAAHRVLAIKHLGLRSFLREDFRTTLELATQVAFGTDDGTAIMRGLLASLSEAKLVYPGTDTLERIGLAGRARARRLAAQSLNNALSADQQAALQDLLIKDPSLGISRLAWLRGMPHSTSVASLHGLLDRLTFVRALHLPADLGQNPINCCAVSSMRGLTSDRPLGITGWAMTFRKARKPDSQGGIADLSVDRVGIENNVIGVEVDVACRGCGLDRFGHCFILLFALAYVSECDSIPNAAEDGPASSFRYDPISAPRLGLDWRGSQCRKSRPRSGHRAA